MVKEDKEWLQDLLDEQKVNFNGPVADIIDLAQQLLDEAPNFLKISKSTNPETGRTLEQLDKRPAVIVLVTDGSGERGIFVKQYRTGSKSHIWECPAGVIEDYQTPEDAVYAELRQEIGLEKQDILRIEKVREVYSSVGWTNEIKHLYVVYVNSSVQLKEQQLDEGEALTYEWKTFEEIEQSTENQIMPVATCLLMQHVAK